MSSSPFTRFAAIPLLAVLALAASPAGEEGAPPPAEKKDAAEKGGEKKPGEKKAGKKAAKAEAGGEKAAGGTAITVAKINTWKKRMRQTYQNGNLTNLAIVVANVLKETEGLSATKLGRECLAMACYYKSGLVGQTGKLEESMDWVEKSIGYGWESADGLESFDMLSGITREKRFVDRMKKLREEVEAKVREEFERSVKDGIARPPAEKLGLPSAPGSLPGSVPGLKPLEPAAISGRPACLIVTPIHHDGFTKEAAILERMAEIYKDKVEICVLFYQNDPADEARKEMTRRYVNDTLHLKSKNPLPAAIVGRDYVKALGIPYFPAHFFLNPEGSVVYRKDGFLEEPELDFILGEEAKLTPKAASAAPKAETAPAPKQEAPPAPKE